MGDKGNIQDDTLIEQAFIDWHLRVTDFFFEQNTFGSLKEQIVLANQLMDKHGLPTSIPVRNHFVSAYFKAVFFVIADAKVVEPWYQRAIGCYNNITNLEDKIFLYNDLILYDIWIGNMNHARMLYRDFLGVDVGSISSPLIHMVRFTLCAQIEWLNMNVDKSIAYVEEGLAYSQKSGAHQWDGQLIGQAVYGLISVQEFEQAEQWLQRFEENKDPERALDNMQYHYLRAWLGLHVDASDAACIHARRAVELAQQTEILFAEAAGRIILSEILSRKKSYIEAGWHFVKALRIGKKMQSKHITFAALIASSWVAIDFHLKKTGIRRLRQAFKLGAANGYFNVPGWPHIIMAELCHIALHEGIEKEYTCQLIRTHRMQPPHLNDVPSDWPWHVELSCFGGLRVRIQGRDIVLGNRQQRVLELLKLLLVHPAGIANQKICDLLWSDAEADAALRSLHTTQLRLRKLLEHQDALVVNQGSTRLNPAIVMNEMVLVKNKLKEINTASADTHEIMAELMQRYAGRLLGNDEHLPWLISHSGNLHRIFLKTVSSYVKALIEQSNHDLAESICLEVLAMDELAEDMYYQLLYLYELSGSSSKVHHLYEQYELLLAQHNLSPSKNISRFKSQL